jgi:hypothetical protein
MPGVFRVFTTAAALALGLSCSRHLEEQVDAERLCSDFCERNETCGLAPCIEEFEPQDESCFDICMDAGPHDWNGPCRFLQDEWYACLGALSCTDFHETVGCNDQPLDERPCADETEEYSLCLSEHR